MRTAKDIQGDIIELLKKHGRLATTVNGEIYRNGYRPRDSRTEDIIVTFTAGTSGEIEEGIVTINIYVPDIDPFDDGVFVENGARCDEIEDIAAQWVESLKGVSPYHINLRQSIYTESEEEIRQHFIVVKLAYRVYNGNY